MEKVDLDLDTTIKKIFGQERRLLFVRRGLVDRVLEWALPMLWLLAAVVTATIGFSL